MFGNLKAEMGRKELLKKDVAKSLGITTKALDNKLNGQTRFYLDEALKLCQILGNASVEYLFDKEA